jgi:hypothetical protein
LQGLFLGAGEVTGGLVAPLIDPDSLTVRIKLPTINDGGGFSVTPSPGLPAPAVYYAPLDPFAAGAFVEIRAVEVPEPLSALLVIAGGLVCLSTPRCFAARR